MLLLLTFRLFDRMKRLPNNCHALDGLFDNFYDGNWAKSRLSAYNITARDTDEIRKLGQCQKALTKTPFVKLIGRHETGPSFTSYFSLPTTVYMDQIKQYQSPQTIQKRYPGNTLLENLSVVSGTFFGAGCL